jgi:hypothetical protein
MFWIALVILVIFLHTIGKLTSILSLCYYVSFLGMGTLFLYLGYDAYHASLSAPLASNMESPMLFADYFSKEALVKKANECYAIGVFIIIGTFCIPMLLRKETV